MPSPPPRLLTGAEYVESLRDGREVWYRGERIADVTTHPPTAAAIAFQARLYDAQHELPTANLLTHETGDGRVPTAWLIPRTRADLERKLAESEHRSWVSFGAFHARQPNHCPWIVLGMLGHASTFDRLDPEHAGNIARYVGDATARNVHLNSSAIDPQGNRARPARAGDDRSAVCRVVRRDNTGIWISGAKAVATGAAQSHEILVGSIAAPHVRPDEAFWCVVPVASEGLRLVCREAVAPHGSPEEHPLAAIGEETDAILLLEEVFVPHERVLALGAPDLCSPGMYGLVAAGEAWIHLARQVVHAELLVGLAELIVEALELTGIPAVADVVAELTQAALVLRGGLTAALEQARPTEDGVLLPNLATTLAFRAHGLELWPRHTQLVQELCGQGLVTRFSQADLAHPELGPLLDRYLATSWPTGEKNRLLDLVHDLTVTTMAGRQQVFENVNGRSAAVLRSLLPLVVDRSPWAERVRELGDLARHRTA